MLRWTLVGLAVLGLVVSWSTSSAAVLGLALLGTFVCVFGALLAFAAERIADRSRPDSAMLSAEDLTALGTRSGPAAKHETRHGPGTMP
jgi:FtsH-binding integral membrane protein